MRRLLALGWSPDHAAELAELGGALRPARVAIEHQDRYTVLTEDDDLDVHLSGRRLAAARRGDQRPAVGDWVALSEGDLIEHLLHRRTAFRRRAAGHRVAPQTVAANVDTVFVVTSCNRELSERRVERYLAAVCDSGATPVVVLNKADLSDDPDALATRIAAIAPGVELVTTSAIEGTGLDDLAAHLAPGRTVALVGSSGVGKSTIGNLLLGAPRLEVGAIREQDDKGRHTTTRRELLLLPEDRGVLIDTPGMRELALWLDPGALDRAFPDVSALASRCRFRDCRHDREPGCAVRGAMPDERLASYERLRAEVTVPGSRKR